MKRIFLSLAMLATFAATSSSFAKSKYASARPSCGETATRALQADLEKSFSEEGTTATRVLDIDKIEDRTRQILRCPGDFDACIVTDSFLGQVSAAIRNSALSSSIQQSLQAHVQSLEADNINRCAE
jgi:hypothetical protein